MKKLRLFISFILIFTLSGAQASNAGRLDQFIKNYPLKPRSIATRYSNLTEALEKIQTEYKLFYEGPDDTGDDLTELDQHYEQTVARQRLAQQFVNDSLKLPREEVNILTVELMQRYLKQPEDRPALREIIRAFSAVKFNDAERNKQDKENSSLFNFSTGFAVTATLAGAFCWIRPKSCSEAGQRARRAVRIQEAARARQAGQRAAREVETAEDILSDIRSRYARVQNGRVAYESVGTTASKESWFVRYVRYNLAEKMKTLALVAGLGSAGGVAYMTSHKILRAKREGKYEYTYLNPEELERLYYGRLAVLELTCEARSHLQNENISKARLQSFVVRAYEDVQLLGRMAGSKAVLDKQVLDFVTPIPEKNQFLARIQLASNKTLTTRHNCPGIAQMGPSISTSLSELEQLILQLMEKEAGLN